MLCTSGEKIRHASINTPTVTAVRPVRPPADTPAALSTYGVVEDVPSAAPATMAVESANRARFRRGSLPSSSRPARWETPTSVPVESNKSTRKKTKITLTMLRVKRPLKSICMKVGAMLGISPTTPLNSLKPSRVEMAVIVRMVRIIAPLTRKCPKATTIAKPASTKSAAGWWMSPSFTKVASLATMMPEPLSAISDRNSPIPAAIDIFKPIGSAFTSISRTLKKLNKIKMMPETNTAPKATCQGTPMPLTTAKVK